LSAFIKIVYVSQLIKHFSLLLPCVDLFLKKPLILASVTTDMQIYRTIVHCTHQTDDANRKNIGIYCTSCFCFYVLFILWMDGMRSSARFVPFSQMFFL